MSLTGDLNNDGKVDAEDLKLLKQLLQEDGIPPEAFRQLSPEEQAVFDITGDGQVSYNDVIALTEKLMQSTSPSAPSKILDRLQQLRAKSRSL